MTDSTHFTGYPPEALQFLADLAENNHRQWFEANKQTYLDSVVAPTQAFVAELGMRLQAISPGIQFDTRSNGQGSMMRIYRDVRFSADKTPYKTNVTMAFWEGPYKKMKNPIFGCQFTYTGGALMAGMHGFEKPVLDIYREAVTDTVMGEELVRATENVRAAGDYQVQGEHYKRVPRGYDPDHPRADLLRYNALYAYSPPIHPDTLLSPELIEVCYQHFSNMAPLQQWLVKAISSDT